MMTDAGESARRIAEEARRKAESHERRAAAQRQRADAFEKGAEGEAAVGQVLTRLMASGWFVLNDRVDPSGGNIDHIVVGPGAVVVLDTKAWNSSIEIRNGRLRAHGRDRGQEVARLGERADAVRKALGGHIPVDYALVMTRQPGLEPTTVDGCGILGVDFLESEIGQAPPVFSRAEVDSMVTCLMEAFPMAGTVPTARSGMKIVEEAKPSALFERGNRVVYIKQWQSYGKRRIYMHDQDDEELGVKDLNSGRITLTHEDDEIARAVLRSATTKGVELRPQDLPKIPLEIPGGRVLGWVGKLYTTVLVGSLWSRGDKRNLYGTLANPADGVFDLGHVDLTTGWVKPRTEGPVAKDYSPAERYLAILRDRCPY